MSILKPELASLFFIAIFLSLSAETKIVSI